MPGTPRSTWSEITLNLMRIVFALMFLQHGVQKLFGTLGRDHPVELMSRFGIAGVLETFGSLLILFGLFTRPVAFLLSGEMAVTYFWMHVPRGWFPILNRGELPVLFSFAWLFLAANGGGSFSLDGLLASRKRRRGP